jgi:exodeoxyribonuclease-3
LRIATWNVNSVRQRQGHVQRWLARVQPDVLVLQEIKCEAPAYPAAVFEAAGYKSVVVGQKSYNGVAALSRLPFEVVHTTLPGLAEDIAQARYIEIMVGGLSVIGIYLPNGNSGGDMGYAAKLAWMDALRARAESLLEADQDFMILGDYNVAPTDEDYAKGALSPNDALVRPATRAKYRSLLWLGLTDAVRALQPSGAVYTFWDYQSAAWQRDSGLRIDHALLSPRVAERLKSAAPDKRERGEDQPSDHVPVLVELAPS